MLGAKTHDDLNDAVVSEEQPRSKVYLKVTIVSTKKFKHHQTLYQIT